MTHDFEDVVDALTAAEGCLPVNEWRASGVQVWPLVRLRLYFSGLSHEFDAANTTEDPRVQLPKSVARLAQMASGAARKQWASWRDMSSRPRRSQQTDVLFFSDGVSFAQFEGKWLERFCDPLIERLAESGVAARLWVPTHNYYIPRYSPSEWVQTRIDAAQLAAVMRASTRAGDLRLQKYSDFLELLNSRPNVSR
jgi:hypothetical protein